MASIAPHQFVCVSPEWGSRTEPPDSLHASPNAAANALKRPVAGLWNGLEPGPILQGPISWPHSVHQLLRSDKRISRSAANSRRPTEAEASHLFGSDPHEALSQVDEERPSSPAQFRRSKSDGKQHHSAAERHTIGCPDDVHRPIARQEDPFRQMFRTERGPHAGRGVDLAGPSGGGPKEEGTGREAGWDAQTAKAVYQRLYTHARNRETRRKEREVQKEKQEMQDVTGRPMLNPHSTSMLRQGRSFEERLSAYEARARRRAQALKDEIEARRAAEEAQHARPPRITKLSKKLSRGVEHLCEWEKLRLARLVAAQEEKRRKEEEALTFSPTLSRRSRKLAARAFRPPRLRLMQLAKPRPPSPPPPLPSFRPAINPSSVALFRHGSVTDRLHYQSHAWYRRKNSSPQREWREEPPALPFPDADWFAHNDESWDQILPIARATTGPDARDWSEATAHGSHQWDQSPVSTRLHVDAWAEDAAALRARAPRVERPWAAQGGRGGERATEKAREETQEDAAPLATTSGRDLGTEPTLARGVGTDSLPSEGDTRPRPNSDPCQTSGRSPGRGDVRPDGGEASAREDVPVAARSPGIKRSQSFREDVKEKEKWRTIRERIQSGPKHWHRLHAPSAAQPEEEPKRGAILKRSMTFSPEPFRASPLEGDPPSVGAASGATEQHATTRKASLKIVIGSDETRTGELGNGVAGQSGGEVGAVTKVPYSSKYRCLFIEA